VPLKLKEEKKVDESFDIKEICRKIDEKVEQKGLSQQAKISKSA
jgi:hypothetical protein